MALIPGELAEFVPGTMEGFHRAQSEALSVHSSHRGGQPDEFPSVETLSTCSTPGNAERLDPA